MAVQKREAEEQRTSAAQTAQKALQMARKQGQEPKAKTGKPKKKKGKLILVIVILVLVLGAGTAAYLALTQNLFGGRDKALSFLQSLDPQYQDLAYRQQQLEQQSQTLDAREKELNDQENQLRDDQQALEQAQQEANQQQATASGTAQSALESYISGLSDDKLTQLKKVGSIYSSMTADQAAKVLPNLGSVNDMAVVLYYMKPAASAQVLNNLDAKLAAQITDVMLK